jgi:PAS domain S-box-containing protein
MLSRMTVKSKLILLLAVAIGASVLLGVAGMLGLRATTASVEEIGVVRLPSIIGLAMMKEGQNAVRAANRGVLGWEGDYRAREKFSEVLRQKKDIWARIDKGWNIYEPLPQTPEEALLWKQFVTEWGEWKNGDKKISDTIFALSENRSTSRQHALFMELRQRLDANTEKFSAAETTLWKITELNADVGNTAMQEGKAVAASTHAIILLIGVSSICVLMLLGGFIVRSILRQLGGDPLYVSQVASRIAAGDLNVRLETKPGDTGSMLMSISHMVRQLRKREQEFRVMVEHSPDIIIRYDTQCRRVYVNPAVKALLGFSAEQVLSKSPEDITPLLDVQGYMQMVRQALATRREVKGEPAFLDAQGAVRWGHTRFVPELGTAGEVVSILAITRDITELKVASQALGASEARMRLFFERQLVGMAITSPEKGWLQVNDKLCEMLGYTRGELMQLNWAELTHPEDLAADLGNFVRLQRGEIDSYMLEKRFVRKDGSIIFTTLAVGCVRRINRSLDYVLLLLEDITERKQAEQQLKASLEFSEGIINAIPDILFEVNRDGRYLNIWTNNPEFLAAQKEAMLGKTVHEVLTPDGAEIAMESIREAEEKGGAFGKVIRIDTLQGEGWFEHSVSKKAGSNPPDVSFLVLARDITKRIKLERDLEGAHAQLRGLLMHREQIREEERKQIAREVHDELGQILSSLKLTLSLLIHKYGAGSQPLREHAQQSLAMTTQAIGVVRNIISALRPVELDMGIVAALKSVTERFSVLTGIKCAVQIEEVRLEADQAGALFRIAQESLTNIARHAAADSVEISLAGAAGEYVLKVRDNGKGFNVDAVKPSSFGLVGMRERVLMLGGTLTIDSRAGSGTEIIVRIPKGNNCD